MAETHENMIKHDEMVKALAKSGEKIAAEINAEDAHLMHMAIGISGEAGELIDAIKKQVIYRKPLDRENVLEELGDLEFYMEGIRQGLGITREQCLEANIAKLGKRYEGMKYTDGAAQERADKVE
jgi:NTP pyrophosphatase (non-canonical NTP hydrolase)